MWILREQNIRKPWYYGLVAYRFGLSGTDGSEIQSEYFIPYKYAVPAIKAVSVSIHLKYDLVF